MRQRELLLGSALVLSGAAALLFETLWFHQASLALGNSVWASSLVLSGFMGGMALGSALTARYGDRPRRAARAYAGLELLVATFGLVLVLVLPGLGARLAPLAAALSELPVLLNVARLLCAFLLLLVPSIAIGATLPLALRAVGSDERAFGRNLGLLYGLNTAGAVLGVLGGELFLLAPLGIRGSALVAAAASVSAAVIGWLLPAPGTVPIVAPDPPAPSSGLYPWPLVASFASGFSLLALEVVWLRLLMLFLNDTPLAFAVVLAAVLVGIAGGSALAALAMRRFARAPACAPLAAYAAGLLGYGGYLLYPLFLQRFLTFDQSAGAVFAVCAPLVLPTAAASGALYVLLGAGLRASSGSDARAAGRLALANTLGSALGAWLAGFVLLPRLGMELSLFGLLVGYGAIGLLLASAREPDVLAELESEPLREVSIHNEGGPEPRGSGGAELPTHGVGTRRAWLDGEGRRVPPLRAAGTLGIWPRRAAIAVFVLAFCFFPFGKVQSVFVRSSAGRWMTPEDRVIGVREGPLATTVHIRHGLLGLALFDQLATNAYSMSVNDFAARRYMQQYVYLPVAVHPRVRSALVVGYGVGNTAAALVDHRELERIHIVDISRDMLEMSRAVEPKRARHPLDDPRVAVHLEDGRYFLQMTRRRFDLITGEPPPPVMAGVGSLYSREYFELVRSRLAPGGFTTYWLPMMNLSAGGAKTIVAAFCAAFEDCSLWHGSARNFMLLGSRGARGGVDAARFAAQFHDSALAPELRAVGFELPEQLAATFIGDAKYLARLTRGVLALTDDFPKRLLQPIDREQRDALIWQWRDTAAARERFQKSPLIARLIPAEVRAAALRQFENQRLLNDLLFPGQTAARQTVVFHQVLHGTRLRLPILLLLGSDPDIQRALRTAPATVRERESLRIHLAAGRLAERDLQGGLELLERVPDKDLRIPDLRAYLRYAIARTGGRLSP